MLHSTVISRTRSGRLRPLVWPWPELDKQNAEPPLRTALRLTEASLIGACDINVALKKAESQFRIIDCDMLQKHDLSSCLRTDLVWSRPFMMDGCRSISASSFLLSQATISLLFTFSSFRDPRHWAAVMPSCPTLGATMQMPSGMPCSPGSKPSVLALDVLQVSGWTKHDTWKQFEPCPPSASASALSRQGINQQDIEANLRSLPIFLSGCETLLILCGTTYLSSCLLKHSASAPVLGPCECCTWRGEGTFQTARTCRPKS